MSEHDGIAELLALTLAGIERGESFSARVFLDRVADDIENGHPVAEPYRTAVVAMLRQVRDARTPFGVPLMRHKRGQKAADARMEARHLAYIVSLVRNSGLQVQQAQRLVSKGYRVTAERVEQAWETHGREFPAPR